LVRANSRGKKSSVEKKLMGGGNIPNNINLYRRRIKFEETGNQIIKREGSVY